MKLRFLSLARSTLVFSLVAMALVFTACLEEDDDFNNFRPVDFFIDADALSIDQGLPITFNDKSNNATSREWTFEGGTPATSTETNPTVIFADPGVYEIKVATTFNDGSIQRRTIFMEVFPTITADFSVNPVPQTPGNPVQLNNLTQGVGDIPGVRPEADSSILYQWVVEGFNDGDTISWVNNPVVSFDEIGTYDVTLRVLRRATGAIDIIRKTDAIEIIETPVFAAEGIGWARDGSSIFIRGNAGFNDPSGSLNLFTLEDSGGTAINFTGIGIAQFSPNVLELSVDASALTDGDNYTLKYDGQDVSFVTDAILGPIDQPVRYGGGAPAWEQIVYAGGNITTSFPLGGGTLNWANTGTNFAWQSNNTHNALIPFNGFLAQAVNPNTDYTITSSVEGGASFDDIRAVGVEFFFIGPGSTVTFSHPITDLQYHGDAGLDGSISADGLTFTVVNQPNRNSVNRFSMILENPADIENLVINHTATPDLNLFATFARY